MIKKIKASIEKKPAFYENFKKVQLSFYRLSSIIPSDIMIKRQYKKRLKKPLNLKDPKSFNEKIQWLKLYWKDDISTLTADKYTAREFVKQVVGEDVLNELYAVYDSVEEIQLESLPKQFVLKVTNAYGGNVICEDKDTINWKGALKKLNRYMNYNQYIMSREWAYKNSKSRIVCERFLSEDGKPPKDYKIFCFNGEPKLIQVDSERFENHTRSFYDLNWDHLNIKMNTEGMGETVERPERLDTMLSYASKLSKKIPFVRIDFYYVNNKIYFGEMTFYPNNGMIHFTPEKINNDLGELIKLPYK